MVWHRITLPSGCLPKWVHQLLSGDTSDSTLELELTIDADKVGEKSSCEIFAHSSPKDDNNFGTPEPESELEKEIHTCRSRT